MASCLCSPGDGLESFTIDRGCGYISRFFQSADSLLDSSQCNENSGSYPQSLPNRPQKYVCVVRWRAVRINIVWLWLDFPTWGPLLVPPRYLRTWRSYIPQSVHVLTIGRDLRCRQCTARPSRDLGLQTLQLFHDFHNGITKGFLQDGR